MNDSVYIFLWFLASLICLCWAFLMESEEKSKKNRLMELSDFIVFVEGIVLVILGHTQVVPLVFSSDLPPFCYFFK